MELQVYRGNWASCLEQLKGESPTSGMQVIQDRIARFKKNSEDRTHFDTGAWLSENTNVVDSQIMVARAPFNPLVPYAKQAVQVHKNGKEFYLEDSILLQDKPAVQILAEIAKADKNKTLVKRRVLIPEQTQTYKVSWDNFADDDVIDWHAQGRKLARNYGKFLHNDCGIDEVTVYLPATNLGNIARGNWLYRLGGSDRSDFDCYNGNLSDEDGTVFGGFSSGEASARKISEPKVRIFQPSFENVLDYSRQYIPQVVQSQFEKGLAKLWKKK